MRILLYAALVAGCNQSSSAPLESKGGGATQPASAPAKPSGNPFARDTAAIAEGRQLYMSRGCQGCHGMGGGGGMGKPILDDEWRFGSDDQTLFKLIRGEIPNQTMPSVIGKGMTDDEVWKTLAFVRTLYKGDPSKINWVTPPEGAGQPAVSAMAAAAAPPTPDPNSDPIANGKSTFISICSPCHGQSGKGDGPTGVTLNPRPRDFTDSAYMSKLKDDYIVQLIQKGGGAMGKSPLMPAQTGLSEKEIRNVIAYVRTLSATQ
jgi:mono/diheme cytochrome c family protein